MMNNVFLCICILILNALTGSSQVNDNFSDGNFSADPVWTGSTTDWVIDANAQLQSNNTVAGSAYYLSTASTLATTAQWELNVSLSFNTSSANYVDIFLTASASDLAAPNTSGYFVRIGNADDEISLYRKSTTGTITKIIDGINGVTNTANNVLKVRVVRDAASQWVLSRDITGTGNAYFSEGVATDASFNTAAFFGILVKQSTAGFFRRHFFDNIEIKPFIPDVTAPMILSATAISANAVDVLFNEPLDKSTSQAAANYLGNNGLGSPVSALLDTANNALVHLVFGAGFSNGINTQLTINGVKDITGNAVSAGTASFVYAAPYIPAQYDLVIDEIMADPTPPVGLPNNEWIELRNTSASPIDLLGWKLGNGSGQSGPLPPFIILPDSTVILCTGSAVAAMTVFGKTIAVSSFPALDNIAGQLYLVSPQNSVIHSVSYNDTWYQNELKQEGGWTLEMIDIKNPCTGKNNWKASTDVRGGSPGKTNSVDGLNADQDAPELKRAYATDSENITLVFDEPLDSFKAANPANYNVSDGIGSPAVVLVTPPAFDRVTLKLNAALSADRVYTVTAQAVTDCVGNVLNTGNSARVGLSKVADSLDIVINEVLFNPPPNGTDYVEIYNRSNKIIDLNQTYLANRGTGGAISSITQFSAEPYGLFPGDFIVITEDASLVRSAYITQKPEALIEVPAMPSFNDDKSSVILLNAQGNITDQLTYTDEWHFKLIDNKEGVSLERIDYGSVTQSADNWHSASTSAGYGTPTFKNSQFRMNDGLQGDVQITPEIVSPDNDGQDDFATIGYKFPAAGYVASITIFDARGRAIRYLQRNALCGSTGSFRWDGLGEKGQRLATGIYVVFTEVFNLEGNRQQFKSAIVLARRN